ncbi:MAG: coat protein [Bradyrhizobiaceae bacterium]|nr:MAG: coat protein [Bradyrhizobiaceae bacterium]
MTRRAIPIHTVKQPTERHDSKPSPITLATHSAPEPCPTSHPHGEDAGKAGSSPLPWPRASDTRDLT